MRKNSCCFGLGKLWSDLIITLASLSSRVGEQQRGSQGDTAPAQAESAAGGREQSPASESRYPVGHGENGEIHLSEVIINAPETERRALGHPENTGPNAGLYPCSH